MHIANEIRSLPDISSYLATEKKLAILKCLKHTTGEAELLQISEISTHFFSSNDPNLDLHHRMFAIIHSANRLPQATLVDLVPIVSSNITQNFSNFILTISAYKPREIVSRLFILTFFNF